MPSLIDPAMDEIDLAVVAYREEGVWQLQELAATALESVDAVLTELRRYPGDFGAVALVAVAEDFFVAAAVRGDETSILLSDATAATEWDLAGSAARQLGIRINDDDEPAPAGDLKIFEPWGLSASELAALVDDYELYPDEQLSEIAARLGFGPKFDEFVGLVD